jgi:hypothetical protein
MAIKKFKRTIDAMLVRAFLKGARPAFAKIFRYQLIVQLQIQEPEFCWTSYKKLSIFSIKLPMYNNLSEEKHTNK